ncbi:hypothetical protein O3W44_13600 [Pantoea sp. LMR881]|uniref:hypothetical protein n=1 Tax=Pantoea sp. LMR881 TaxID=3014336 RepID=UPI0022AF2CE1|nr:hypothetical protein [Pantoea sp. LMR881]MCZ4059895.1 hypothetical protein [Pantoea sp. LMR881]
MKIIKYITIFISTLLGASLLKGAGVGYDSWYAAPAGLSKLLIIILTLLALTKISLYLVEFFYNLFYKK